MTKLKFRQSANFYQVKYNCRISNANSQCFMENFDSKLSIFIFKCENVPLYFTGLSSCVFCKDVLWVFRNRAQWGVD